VSEAKAASRSADRNGDRGSIEGRKKGDSDGDGDGEDVVVNESDFDSQRVFGRDRDRDLGFDPDVAGDCASARDFDAECDGGAVAVQESGFDCSSNKVEGKQEN
jgi:hypothetical protein